MFTGKKFEVSLRDTEYVLCFLLSGESAKVTYKGMETIQTGTGAFEYPAFVVQFDRVVVLNLDYETFKDRIKVLDEIPYDFDDGIDYELLYHYSNGCSHGGPFHGYKLAIERAEALIRGCETLQTVYLVPRTAMQYSTCNATYFMSRSLNVRKIKGV